NPSNAQRALAPAYAAAGITNMPGRLTVDRSFGRSRYDGLNVSFRRRMANHWSLNTTYTLSRGVGYRGSAASFGNAAVNPNNPYRVKDFGVVPNDELHHWSVSSVVDLPWGFQISPIMQLASARPWNASSGLDVYNSTTSGISTPSAIVLASNPGNLQANKGLSAAQLRACLFSGQCIESHFDQVRGIPYFQLDTRVSKMIKFGEQKNLKLIFQGFDLTNRANYGNNYFTNVRTATFGTPAGYITGSGTIVPKSFRAEFGGQFTF